MVFTNGQMVKAIKVGGQWVNKMVMECFTTLINLVEKVFG